jgi:hypothetical protein
LTRTVAVKTEPEGKAVKSLASDLRERERPVLTE